MTEQEIERCLERLSTCKPTDVMNFDYAGTLAYIQRLKAENAALRERLSHSLELPYMEQTVSRNGTEDTILYYLENGKLQQECFNNKFPEQLQARLAELKGEKNG